MGWASLILATSACCMLADDAILSTPIHLQLRPGETIGYRFTDQQTIQDQAPDSPVIESKTISYLSLRPTRTDSIGYRLTAQYDRVQVSLKQGKTESSVDTAERPPRREPPTLAMYREWIGRPMQVELDPWGGVLQVDPADPATKSPSITAAVAHLRRHLLLLWSWIPREPLGTQKSWTRHEKLAAGLVDLTRDNSLSIAAEQGTRLMIHGVLRLSAEPTKREGPNGESVITSIVAPEPGRANITFDTQQGHVVQIESAIDFGMNVTRVSTPAPGETGQARTAVPSSQKLQARSVVQFLSRGAPPAAN